MYKYVQTHCDTMSILYHILLSHHNGQRQIPRLRDTYDNSLLLYKWFSACCMSQLRLDHLFGCLYGISLQKTQDNHFPVQLNQFRRYDCGNCILIFLHLDCSGIWLLSVHRAHPSSVCLHCILFYQ